MTIDKRACLLLCDGFEEIEAVTVVDVLRRADVQVSVLGVDHRTVTGSHGLTLKVDASLADVIDLGTTFDLVVLPGGMPGAGHLRDSDRARGFVVGQRA
ncbi:MAG TPA: DJ-1/PfpI family protein, partial [Myxococcota bacterium]